MGAGGIAALIGGLLAEELLKETAKGTVEYGFDAVTGKNKPKGPQQFQLVGADGQPVANPAMPMPAAAPAQAMAQPMAMPGNLAAIFGQQQAIGMPPGLEGAMGQVNSNIAQLLANSGRPSVGDVGRSLLLSA